MHIYLQGESKEVKELIRKKLPNVVFKEDSTMTILNADELSQSQMENFIKEQFNRPYIFLYKKKEPIIKSFNYSIMQCFSYEEFLSDSIIEKKIVSSVKNFKLKVTKYKKEIEKAEVANHSLLDKEKWLRHAGINYTSRNIEDEVYSRVNTSFNNMLDLVNKIKEKL